jgi:hypothetical protein
MLAVTTGHIKAPTIIKRELGRRRHGAHYRPMGAVGGSAIELRAIRSTTPFAGPRTA